MYSSPSSAMMCKGADRVTFQQGDCKSQICSIYSVVGWGVGACHRASFYDRPAGRQVDVLI